MSTLRCTNLQDTSGGNSLTTAQIYNGAAKAWVNFNGTGTVAIRAQFNVSSITDNGTGDYTVNFSTALTDANYSAIGTATNVLSQYAAYLYGNEVIRPRTVSSWSLNPSSSAQLFDAAWVNVAIFR